MKKSIVVDDEKTIILKNVKVLLKKIQDNDFRLSCDDNYLLHQYYNTYFNSKENNPNCTSCVNRLYTILLNELAVKNV